MIKENQPTINLKDTVDLTQGYIITAHRLDLIMDCPVSDTNAATMLAMMPEVMQMKMFLSQMENIGKGVN